MRASPSRISELPRSGRLSLAFAYRTLGLGCLGGGCGCRRARSPRPCLTRRRQCGSSAAAKGDPMVHRESQTRLQQRHRDECRGQSGGRRQDRGRSAQCSGVARRAAAAGSGRMRGALTQALCRQASDAGSVQLHRGVRLSVIRGLETAGSGHEDPFPRTRPNRQRRRIAPIRLGYPNRRTTIRH